MENKIWNLDIRIILLTVNWQRQNIWQWCNDIKVLSRIQIFRYLDFELQVDWWITAFFLTLIWLEFLGDDFAVVVGRGIKKLLRIMLEIWFLTTKTYVVSESIPFRIKTSLILLMSAFFVQKISIFSQKQYFYSKQLCKSWVCKIKVY